MASRLSRGGFRRVTVLERRPDDGTFGKTHTFFHEETKDVPHEMGTCYLSASYKHIRSLLSEYVGDDATIEPGGGRDGPFGEIHLPAPRLNAEKAYETTTSDEWLYAHREKVFLSEKLWAIAPDKLQAVGFLLDVKKYRDLHKSLLGTYDYHGLPPQPGPGSLARLDVTFRELLVANKLEALLDLCCIGFGSYGLGYDVPALYGLWFVTPEAVESYVASKLDPSVKTVELVRNGYNGLWRAMIARDDIEVRHCVSIAGIDRNLDDLDEPIVIEANVDGHSERIECDFLIFAAPLATEFLKTVADPTPFEIEMVGGLTSAGLVTTLFRTANKGVVATETARDAQEQALTFYPESLQPAYTPQPDGEVYAERNSVRSYRWDTDSAYESRYSVAYQYVPTPRPDSDMPRLTAAAVAFITSPETAVTPTPTHPEPEVLYQKNWDYFPHFTQDAIKALVPWRVLEHQGRWRTWYIGSSVSFESVEDVTKYNLLVLRMNGVEA
jgi:hypothetical protein